MKNLKKFETEEAYGNVSLEYPTVSYTEDTDKVWIEGNPIGTFSINSEYTYNFVIGMTWAEFIDSEYNSYIDEDGNVYKFNDSLRLMMNDKETIYNSIFDYGACSGDDSVPVIQLNVKICDGFNYEGWFYG